VLILGQNGRQDTGAVAPGKTMAFVYKITNTITNKCYIGWTGNSVEKRWAEHKVAAFKNTDNRKFYNALRKYDIQFWSVETLIETSSKEEAKIKEIELIEYFDSYNKGYNATKGGDGNNGIIMSEESNLRRSEALKGKPKSEATIEKFKARTPTEETTAKISLAHKGMKKPWVKWSPEQIAKRAMTRRSLTKEQYDTIHRLRLTGMTIREIHQSTEISVDLVKKWLKLPWDL